MVSPSVGPGGCGLYDASLFNDAQQLNIQIVEREREHIPKYSSLSYL